MRVVVVSGLGLWAGGTLVLSRLPWFRHRSLTERIQPYVLGGPSHAQRAGALSVESFAAVAQPVVRLVAGQLAAVVGRSSGLAARLARVHSPLDVTGFRLRQVGWSTLGLAGGTVLAIAARLPTPLAMLFILGLPVLAALLLEQGVISRFRAWQRRLSLELPVVSEQLAMLLSAGYSLGAALNRLAARGDGVCAQELALVRDRVQQGLPESDALREWADRAAVEPLERLVAVLTLHRNGGDLARLVSEEAGAIRADAHRQLIETIERRAQQVWIPVTVATLVPGVIFLAVPFIEAMRLFAGT